MMMEVMMEMMMEMIMEMIIKMTIGVGGTEGFLGHIFKVSRVPDFPHIALQKTIRDPKFDRKSELWHIS